MPAIAVPPALLLDLFNMAVILVLQPAAAGVELQQNVLLLLDLLSPLPIL